MEDWTEVIITVDAENADAAADIAQMVVPYGIYMEDYSNLEAEAMEIAHVDLIDEDLLAKDRSKGIVHIYLSPDAVPAEALAFLSERYTAEKITHEITTEVVQDADWANEWKKYFQPLEIGEHLVICPSWVNYENESNRKVLSIDPETLRKALHSAFRFAQEEERLIQHVAPAGATKGEWEAAVRVQEFSFPSLSVSALSAPDAMEDIILSPEKMGLLLCPPYAGSILQSAANALCNHPMLIHDISFDENIGLYSPYIPAEITEPLNPVTAALCVARLLRYSLGLSTEAGCVEAAVNNVLSAWHAPSAAPIDPEELMDLICEQVNVAGELMGKPLPS